MKIILIGFMGSGKTTIARALSTLLDLKVVDMDEQVYKKTGYSTMGELFSKKGELLLRETEIAIAKEYRGEKNLVMATGGGIVMNQIALTYLQEGSAKIIFLQAPLKLLLERIQGDSSRPLLATAKTLYELRTPLYHYYANKVISVEKKSVEDITKEIIYGP